MRTKSLLLGALTLFAAATMVGCTKEDPKGGQTQKIYREAQGTTGDLTWKLTSDGTLTISGEGAMPDYEAEWVDGELISVDTPWFDLEFTSVVIESGVTTIGDYAFASCRGFTSITIPDSVTTIYDSAFTFCTGMTSIEVAADNPNYSSEGGVLFDKGKTTLIKYPAAKSGTTYTIPNSVTEIEIVAFDYCTGLTSITIPDSVIYIDPFAFYGCSGLTSVTIGSSVRSINTAAFAACTSLTIIEVDAGNPNYSSEGGVLFDKDKTTLVQYPGGKSGAYTIPNSVTTIRDCAFYGCSGLTSVTIPNSVTTIGSYAFEGCTSLTDVTIMSTTPPKLGNYNFSTNSSDTLHVPVGCVAAYEAAEKWRAAFTNIVEQ
jgi:hypothetical protein